MTKARAIRVVALTVALAILIVLVARLGPTEVFDALSRVGADATWLLVVYVAGIAVGALPFYVMLAREERPTLHHAMVGRFAASGINVIVPLLGLGGEPTRLLWLAPEHRTVGVAAILVDRLTYAVASALFLVGGAFAAMALADLPASYTIAGLIAAGVLLVLAVGVLYLLSRHGIADRVHRLAVRLRRRAATDRSQFGVTIDRALEAMLRRRTSLVEATSIGLVARFVLGAEIYIAFEILGVDLSPAAAYVFASVPVLLTFVGAVVPGQLGLQEGAQALVAGALGIDPALAVAAVLLTRVRQLVTGALAWMLVLGASKRR